MQPDLPLDPTSWENASPWTFFLETDSSTLSQEKTSSALSKIRMDWSKLTIRSEETQDIPSELWMSFQLRRLERPSEFYMMWKEDSKPTRSMRKKPNSSSARSRERLWDQTKSPTLSLMMEEHSDTHTQILKRTTLLRYIILFLFFLNLYLIIQYIA